VGLKFENPAPPGRAGNLVFASRSFGLFIGSIRFVSLPCWRPEKSKRPFAEVFPLILTKQHTVAGRLAPQCILTMLPYQHERSTHRPNSHGALPYGILERIAFEPVPSSWVYLLAVSKDRHSSGYLPNGDGFRPSSVPTMLMHLASKVHSPHMGGAGGTCICYRSR
jgi:hypothetical protein